MAENKDADARAATAAIDEGVKAGRRKPKSLLSRFLAYYRPVRGLFVADCLCAIAVAGIDLVFPQLLRWLTRGPFTQGPEAVISVLAPLAAGLIAMYLVRFACKYFVTSWGHIMGARMESEMRRDLFDAYERLSVSYYDRHKTGDLMSRLVNDLFDISETAHHGPEFLLIGAVEVIGAFAILLTVDVPLTVALVLITALLVWYNYVANKRMQAVYSENRVRIAGVNARLEDSLAGIRVVKGFAAEGLERGKFARANEAYLDSKERMYQVMGRYQAAIALMLGALYTAIAVFGGWRIAQGQLDAVDLATYALYVTLFVTPITNILNFTETFQKALAGFRRFCEIVDTVPEVRDAANAKPLQVTRGAVSYHDVSFSYNEGEEVLRGMDLDIAPGETIALVGPSGGGKTTTCALLQRFYDVDRGSIQIDGQDVRAVTQRSLREAIGMVQQDVYLFDGTVAENIAYGRPDATPGQIRDAAAKANIADFIEGLPEGYETQVGERGARLSGGQKQRIAIARVFLKDPAILILDEATSALDNESEAAVQESLVRLSAGRTTIVIAHRLSTIRGADEIATVEGGRVVERGTHEELLARGGTYAHYCRIQFGGEE